MAAKESNTRSFVLRIDAETMDAIEQWAADEFRSTNGQLQWIIAEALRRSGRRPRAKRKTSNLTTNETKD
ncbi:MAG: DNA-binding protein [Alistipes sp.]|nr:DNA-binding protein [Alistipes sp.]